MWSRFSGCSYPFVVIFNVTHECNFNCGYCCDRDFPTSDEDLSTAQVRLLLDELSRAGVLRLSFLGGEPLMRPDIGEIVRHAVAGGLSCTMTTNGKYVKENIPALRLLDSIGISLDGRKENNDRVRGGGAFDTAMEAIAECRKNGIKTVINSVITKYTAGDIDFIAELARQNGCSACFTAMAQQGQASGPAGNILPSTEEACAALERIIELKDAGAPLLFSSPSYRESLFWLKTAKDGEVKTGSAGTNCLAGRYFCLIDHNGDVYPCPRFMPAASRGNVLRNGLKEAMAMAAGHGCSGCSLTCSIELTRLFRLRLETIWGVAFNIALKAVRN